MSIPATAQTELALAKQMVADAHAYAEASKSSSTRIQYERNWTHFEFFCKKYRHSYEPAASIATIATYLAYVAKSGRSVSTVVGHLSAIRHHYDRRRVALNWEDPALTEVVAGIRRSSKTRRHNAAALSPEDMGQLVQEGAGEGNAGLRNRAMMLVGFSGALRRSEIVELQAENVEFVPEGMILFLERSKTDQEGEGADVYVPRTNKRTEMCAVRAMEKWLEAGDITEGPVFRSVNRYDQVLDKGMTGEAVRKIMNGMVERSGVKVKGRVSPHSLRAGFCTAAAMAGETLENIASHVRHTSIQTTIGYVRKVDRFKNHPGSGLL